MRNKQTTNNPYDRQTRVKPRLRGFTLIELLLVVSIIGILFFIGLSTLGVFRAAREVESSAQKIEAALSRARSETLASRNAQSQGVYMSVGSSTITHFLGTFYDPEAANNKIIQLGRNVVITDLGGASSTTLIFQRLTGRLGASGTITVAHNAQTAASTTITYYESGITTQEE